MNLLSTQNLVESPFIIAQIGNYTFGNYSKISSKDILGTNFKVMYPNFMDSIDVVKINGAVNIYTLKMVYGITAGDDPNLLDKIFGSISNTRKITLSYGDWCSPTFIYKQESAIITKISSSIDFGNSRITYNLSCTSDSLSLQASLYNFPAREAKPSDIIKELLYNKQYKLTDIFYGMTKKNDVMRKNLIASDDKKVKIEAKSSISILDYLNYLVNCMSYISDSSNSTLKNSKYYLSIVDDVSGELRGPYFKITRVDAKIKVLDSLSTYEVDVGYPGDNNVTSFSVTDDQSWSILYNYSDEIDQQNYIYRIDNNGNMITQYSPSISTSSELYKQTEASKTWWTNMTQFPINANIVIKGLIRPTVLMSYLKINAYFYGQKHVSSGLYIITRQQDSINSSGYKTSLSLVRIGEEDKVGETI